MTHIYVGHALPTVDGLVFNHGDEFYTAEHSTRRVILESVNERRPLPIRMRCSYVVTTQADGRERVRITYQAISKHGKRYESAGTEQEAQKRILRWAKRTLARYASTAQT
jgi:hypothetical protein